MQKASTTFILTSSRNAYPFILSCRPIIRPPIVGRSYTHVHYSVNVNSDTNQAGSRTHNAGEASSLPPPPPHGKWKWMKSILDFIKDNQLASLVAFCISTFTIYHVSQMPDWIWFRTGKLAALKYPTPQVVSDRKDVVEKVRTFIHSAYEKGRQTFLVIIGPQGVGKSTALNSALEGLPGVITLENKIAPGTKKNEILVQVMRAIAGENVPDNNLFSRAKQVIDKYLSYYKTPIIVVIQADQRNLGKPFAEISQAARDLTELYRLRVIIDASDNAMPDTPLTSRELYLNVEPMSNELMSKLSTHEDLIAYLKAHGMLQVVLAICGGRPAELWRLNEIWIKQKSEEARVQVIKEFVVQSIKDAITKFKEFEGVLAKEIAANGQDKHQPKAKIIEAFNLFHSSNNIEKNVFLEKLGLYMLPDYKGIFRSVHIHGVPCFVPATGAMAVILRTNLQHAGAISFESISGALKN